MKRGFVGITIIILTLLMMGGVIATTTISDSYITTTGNVTAILDAWSEGFNLTTGYLFATNSTGTLTWATALNGTLLTYANALNSTFVHATDWNATNGIYYGVFNFTNNSNWQVLTSTSNGNISFGNGGFFWNAVSSLVGIGTINPTRVLDVNGTINASQILINGTAVTIGGITWAQALNGTLATWTNVVNGTMLSWAQALNGTLATWANAMNGSLWTNANQTTNYTTNDPVYRSFAANFSNFTNVWNFALNGSTWTANYSLSGPYLNWSRALNGTLATWASVVNGSVATWANAMNGSLVQNATAGNFQIGISNNITIGNVLNISTMGPVSLPTCGAPYNGTIMRNTSGLMYCNGSSLWVIIASG